jgi:hypothetical protein
MAISLRSIDEAALLLAGGGGTYGGGGGSSQGAYSTSLLPRYLNHPSFEMHR